VHGVADMQGSADLPLCCNPVLYFVTHGI
jgi:hypothetical protein